MQTVKGNYVLVRIGWLHFTETENENRYLTDVTNNITF